MSGDKMEVEIAEEKMKNMEHSEQHYFKRSVTPEHRCALAQRNCESRLTLLAMTTMV